MNCKELCKLIEKSFPLYIAKDYDNVGLLVGRETNDIKKVLVSLEVTEKVIDEAIEKNADIIVSHHPLIFKPLKKITDSSYVSNMVFKLIENKIGLYAAHTNFDGANGGMNDILCEELQLANIEYIEDKGGYGIGRIGVLNEPMNFNDFCLYLKKKFNIESLIVSGDLNKTINKVGVVGGSGSDFLRDCLRSGCDCLVTGDVKHHIALDYSNMGINIVDLTHYASEIIFKEAFKYFLSINTDLEVVLSEVEENPLKII